MGKSDFSVQLVSVPIMVYVVWEWFWSWPYLEILIWRLFFIFSIKRSRTTKTVTWRDLNWPNLNWTFYSEVMYMYVDKTIYVNMSMLICQWWNIISACPFLERFHNIYFIKVSQKMYFEYSFWWMSKLYSWLKSRN